MKKILLISGNDPHGLAGVSIDIKTVTALGCHPFAAVTALTTQDISGQGRPQPVNAEVLREQLNAFRETDIDAIKIGLVPNTELLEVISAFLTTRPETFTVLDPIGFSSGGSQLSSANPNVPGIFLSSVNLITPNIPEIKTLTGRTVRNREDLHEAGEALQKDWQAVLLKGGHGEEATDLLFTGDKIVEYQCKRLPHECRGTGCALSSAIACFIALGLPLEAAVKSAKAFVYSAMKNPAEIEAKVFSLGLFQAVMTTEEISTKKVPKTLDENILKVQELVNALKELNIAHLLPEIQANIAYAEGMPEGIQGVVGIPGRLVRLGKSFTTVALPAYGATRHIAKVLLTCKKKDPSVTTVIDICYRPELVEKLKEKGYSCGSFSRADEPANIRELEGSTLEWGTGKAIEELGYVPDFIYDEGGMGKEPVIRLIAREPMPIAGMIKALL